MKILVTHSSSFDFENELYLPIKNSELYKKHQIVLPQEDLGYGGMSKEIFKDFELIIAEVSYASTGQGIELGWADLYGIPIICFYKKGLKHSKSLNKMTDRFIEYGDSKDLVIKLELSIDK